MPSLFPHILGELSHGPHALLDIAIPIVLLDTVVGEVNVPVVDVLQRKVICAESKVTVLIKPYFGRAKILNQYPLPDIKFFIFDYEGVLNILLHHKLACSSTAIVNNII